MKFLQPGSVVPLLATLASLTLTFPAVAQQKAADPKSPPENIPEPMRGLWSPLGLPRLRTTVKSGQASPLAPGSYDVDALAVAADAKSAAGSRAVERGSVHVLELDAGLEWSRPLRKSGREAQCVSFLLYASDTTVIVVDGAWLGVAQSPVQSCLQLMIGEPSAAGLQWRDTGILVLKQVFGGQTMASFPVITVRLDPKAGVWDLYSGSRQVADNVALAKPGSTDANAGKFLVRPGNGRAWLCGLVQTEDNPLFEDTNGNGIDDAFEREKKGGLLPASLTPAERAAAAKEWRETARTQRSQAWLIDKPRPD